MIPQNLKVIQLSNGYGNHEGLYMTTRDDIENFQDDFDNAFANQEHHLDDDELIIMVDKFLEEEYKIFRVYAEEVTTQVI
jgi:hypothetical protein